MKGVLQESVSEQVPYPWRGQISSASTRREASRREELLTSLPSTQSAIHVRSGTYTSLSLAKNPYGRSSRMALSPPLSPVTTAIHPAGSKPASRCSNEEVSCVVLPFAPVYELVRRRGDERREGGRVCGRGIAWPPNETSKTFESSNQSGTPMPVKIAFRKAVELASGDGFRTMSGTSTTFRP